MLEGKIFLELKNQLSELARVSQAFSEFQQHHQLPSEVAFDMHLALEEIIANVIAYGFEDDTEHHIRVSLFLEPGELRAEVEDDGKSFNPLEAPPPDTEQPLTERAVGGLGIHLVRHLMDEIVYRRRGGRNVLVLRKQLRP
jgi:serine/threonine-protein kinase RsbW/sigma-B regulation protein RsbU (phosphoserine phosphatase)